MPLTTRDRIVNAAQELLQTRSFTGFSFDELAKRVGIRKPSLYHHFKSKNELGAEVLARATERLEAIAQAGGELSGAEQLRSYLEAVGDALGAGKRLCPAGSVTANWAVVPTELRDSVRRMGRVHFAWLARVLAQGRKDGSLKTDGRDLEAMARWIFASVQGGLMLARISGERKSYDQVTAELMAALDATAR